MFLCSFFVLGHHDPYLKTTMTWTTMSPSGFSRRASTRHILVTSTKGLASMRVSVEQPHQRSVERGRKESEEWSEGMG